MVKSIWLGYLQLVLTAVDSAQYPRSAPNSCTVTINVERNRYPPVWQNLPYDFTITRQALAGSTVSNKILATDADAPVSTSGTFPIPSCHSLLYTTCR